MESQSRLTPAAKRHSRRLRREMTDAEQHLWQYLRGRQLSGHKFRRQHPLGRYVLDFVSLEARLVIELDGGQHLDLANYDRLRAEWLNAKGFRVLRFWNHEVLSQTEKVRTKIWQALHRDAPPPSQPSPSKGEGEE